MKRLIIALLVGGAVFGTVWGVAAGLQVSGGSVQVGSDNTLQCDPDGVSVSYNIDYNGVVTSVQVNDIHSDCTGNRLIVVLKDGFGDMFGTGGAVDGGTGGAPIHPMPTLLFTNLGNAPCSSTSCKVQIAPVDTNGVNTTGGHGVPGADIWGVTVMIEGDNP
jgi:hypothetical protein